MLSPFNEITTRNKEKLLRSLRADTISVKKNVNICNLVTDKNSICIVIDGYIKITRINSNGNEIIIDELKEDDVFGSYISYIDNPEYNITTLEDTNLIIVDINEIINFKENTKSYYNTFVKNLFLIYNEILKNKTDRIEILSKRTIRNKLLEYFNIERKKFSSNNIYLPFSFQALADYIGVDRSAMSRELRYLKEEGFIEIKGKRITLFLWFFSYYFLSNCYI